MKIFPVAILAGGLATRLRPMTEQIPKSLIEVAGKAFICHQLDYLQAQGVVKVVLCTGYLGEMIEKVVGSGSQWGMDISYSMDGSILLGTGGAIKKALPLLGESFFILYGDSYLPINYKAVQSAFIKTGKSGLMTIMKNVDQWDSSNVIYLNGNIIEYNKYNKMPDMDYIDYGLGVLGANQVDDLFNQKPPFDLAEIYHKLSLRSELANYVVTRRFYEIGSYAGIAETEAYLLENDIK